MHLLALVAFSRMWEHMRAAYPQGLNAPFGARCFLTKMDKRHNKRSERQS